MQDFYTKDLLRDEIARFGYEIGDFTYGRPTVLQWNEGKTFRCGKYCSIAAGVTIFIGGNHRTDWVSTYPFSALVPIWPEAAGIEGHPQSNGDVVLGNDVWLGAQCTIMSGRTIGNGAVVAAFAVVTKDVPPYAIVGGNPAKVIRYRFTEQQIARLNRLCWWDWPESVVRSVVPDLVSADIDGFLERAEALVRAGDLPGGIDAGPSVPQG